jgi:hypothetical protein
VQPVEAEHVVVDGQHLDGASGERPDRVRHVTERFEAAHEVVAAGGGPCVVLVEGDALGDTGRIGVRARLDDRRGVARIDRSRPLFGAAAPPDRRDRLAGRCELSLLVRFEYSDLRRSGAAGDRGGPRRTTLLEVRAAHHEPSRWHRRPSEPGPEGFAPRGSCGRRTWLGRARRRDAADVFASRSVPTDRSPHPKTTSTQGGQLT